MNKNALITGTLAAAIALGSAAAPALADGAASVRNVLIGGAAAAVLVTNYNHKKHIKNNEMQEQSRRQTSYKSSYYRKYGRYPTDAETRSWYVRTYGVNPS